MTERGGVEARLETHEGQAIYLHAANCPSFCDYACNGKQNHNPLLDAIYQLVTEATDLRAQLAAAEEAAHSALDLLEAERRKLAASQEALTAEQTLRRIHDACRESAEKECDELRTQRTALSQDLLRLQGEVAALREALHVVRRSLDAMDEHDSLPACSDVVRAVRVALAPRRG